MSTNNEIEVRQGTDAFVGKHDVVATFMLKSDEGATLRASGPCALAEATYATTEQILRWPLIKVGGTFGRVWKGLHDMIDYCMMQHARKRVGLLKSTLIEVTTTTRMTMTVLASLYGDSLNQDSFYELTGAWFKIIGDRPGRITFSHHGYNLLMKQPWWTEQLDFTTDISSNRCVMFKTRPPNVMGCTVCIDADIPNHILCKITED